MKIPPEWFDKAQDYLYFGTLGAFAALVGCLWQVARKGGQPVALLTLFSTTVVGFYLGMLFGGIVSPEWANRDAVVLLIGATGLKGFEVVLSVAKNTIPVLLRATQQPPPTKDED